MKRLIVLTGENCGYCKKAKMLIRRALEKEQKFIALHISFISEDSTEGQKMPHMLVPAFFADGALKFEGNPTMDIITGILKECYETSSS